MPLQPNTTLGPYTIVGILGEGGMGAVYRAKDTRLGRDVAVKVLTNVTLSDRDRLQRFEQEARATGMLNHPNLLTVFDVGRDDAGNPFLVTELLEGETLSSRLQRGPLSARKAVDAALQMSNGLAAAHEKGIVHRDLKPDNIFLTRDGRLKILDFGIAKLTGPAAGDGPAFASAATEPGMVLGTVGYMSPEQVRGEPVDHRSDLFSLGTIVYEMLTGARAFKGNSSIETLSAILKEDPPDLIEVLPSVPPALERLVRRCLEKDREQRFQSARDLAFNLETLNTLSTSHTLSNAPRPATQNAQAHSGSHTAPTMAMPKAAHAPTSAHPAAVPPATRTVARPLTKPKKRVSPMLLALLYVVSVAGAAYGAWTWAQRKSAEKIVEPQFHRITFRRGEVRTARFTPDGETIVYSAAWDGRAPETFVTTRRSSEARPLGVPHCEILSVSRKAELAVLLRRDRVSNVGTLARVPLAGGMPREVAENVLMADWSPDGTNLAVLVERGEKRVVEYPAGVQKYDTAHPVRDLRVAPDGKRLAILELSQGQWEVAVIGDKPETIARGWPRGATALSWSPDGREIFVSGAMTAAPPALYAVNVETGDVRLVTRLTGAIRIFDVSSRGEILLSNGTWRASLFWKTPDKQAATPVTDTNPQSSILNPQSSEMDASWLDWSILNDLSPDGRSILFSETREGGGERHAVYLRRADAPSPVHLGDGIGDALSPDGKWALCHQGAKLVLMPTGTGQPRELKIDGAFDGGAAWLPDSRRAIVAGVVGKDSYRLHLIDTLDETTKPVSPNVWSDGTRAFAVSPDGTIVAGMTSEETIALYALDGTAPRPVPGTVKGEIPLEWSADGTSLFVHDPTVLPARVHRVNIAAGTRELWKEFTPRDPAGVYKIAPVFVTRDAGAYAYNAMRTLSELYVAEGLK
ncbi:MAG TPA: protein kinase [Thermoanaerobaculia bacterium]|nr:protein kinase [Thermoanaerobaculia bacterium]